MKLKVIWPPIDRPYPSVSRAQTGPRNLLGRMAHIFRGRHNEQERSNSTVRSRLWTWLSIECRLRRRLLVRRRQSIRFQSPRPPRLRQHLAAARHPTTSDEVALAFPSDPNITACVCIPFVFVLAGGSRRMRALVLDLFCYCANWSLPQGCGHLPEFQLILTHIRFYQG